ncbi:hypothetical protein EG344_05050 [Chryseobacterium sp. G0162]|uniref:hypothetical protein n=1 Tax=Chryseobacterium sp. G0162 TaxID=2487063 RepID=UPI000F6CA584|nr:hypothetical protein [Chryseobacterium sp. G0162]AZB08271.1 hypothetical protein EG344_05050 [Chryseobacterium sp. G0162]
MAGFIFLTAFSSQNKKKFDEIDVVRINILQKDGRLRVTISNKERSPVAGMTKIDFLDEKRNVTYSLPNSVKQIK